MNKDSLIYVRHILDAIHRIEEYTEGVEHEDFMNNDLVQAGVIREIILVLI